jgi:hypothetical protein
LNSRQARSAVSTPSQSNQLVIRPQQLGAAAGDRAERHLDGAVRILVPVLGQEDALDAAYQAHDRPVPRDDQRRCDLACLRVRQPACRQRFGPGRRDSAAVQVAAGGGAVRSRLFPARGSRVDASLTPAGQ